MAHRKINVTVVEVSSPDDSLPVNSMPVKSTPANRLDRMAFATGDRRGLFAGPGLNGRERPNRSHLVPGADPYIAQLVDRLSRQMAAESTERI